MIHFRSKQWFVLAVFSVLAIAALQFDASWWGGQPQVAADEPALPSVFDVAQKPRNQVDEARQNKNRGDVKDPVWFCPWFAVAYHDDFWNYYGELCGEDYIELAHDPGQEGRDCSDTTNTEYPCIDLSAYFQDEQQQCGSMRVGKRQKTVGPWKPNPAAEVLDNTVVKFKAKGVQGSPVVVARLFLLKVDPEDFDSVGPVRIVAIGSEIAKGKVDHVIPDRDVTPIGDSTFMIKMGAVEYRVHTTR